MAVLSSDRFKVVWLCLVVYDCVPSYKSAVLHSCIPLPTLFSSQCVCIFWSFDWPTHLNPNTIKNVKILSKSLCLLRLLNLSAYQQHYPMNHFFRNSFPVVLALTSKKGFRERGGVLNSSTEFIPTTFCVRHITTCYFQRPFHWFLRWSQIEN